MIAQGGRVLGRAELVEEAAVRGDRGGDLEDERARGVGAPPLPGRRQGPGLQIREAHRRSPTLLLRPMPADEPLRLVTPCSEGGGIQNAVRAAGVAVAVGHSGRSAVYYLFHGWIGCC